MAQHTQGLVAQIYLIEEETDARIPAALLEIVAERFDARCRRSSGPLRRRSVRITRMTEFVDQVIPVPIFLITITVVTEVAYRAIIRSITWNWTAQVIHSRT